MSDKNFPEVIKEIHQKDKRYGKVAYLFIREALDHTLKSLDQKKLKNKGHVSGVELLEGIRDYALDRFGPMLTNFGTIPIEFITILVPFQPILV